MSVRNRSTRGRGPAAHPLASLLGVATVAILGVLPARPAGATPCWFPPVEGTVTDPFREPPCRWCAGNRGLDYRVGDDALVRTAASGRVEFVGTVVDISYVVVRLPNGWRHTYGQLASTSKQRGELVLAGAPIGRASGTFFFGLRIGDEYADPAVFIGVLRGRPRLIPLDGTRARPVPAPQPRCRLASAAPASDERNGRIRSVRSSPRGPIGWR